MSEEMSDSEMWKLYREHSKETREKNRAASPEILKAAGINYISKNGGAHLIVTHNGVTADLWPGTGKWHIRNGSKGRGVRNLIRKLLEVKP